MFASLLAASRASKRGRVGCTRTDALMNAGFPEPSGSRPPSCPFDLCDPADPNGPSIDALCASGCGAADVGPAECKGDWNADLDGVAGALSGEGV